MWVSYKITAYDNAGKSATRDNSGYCYKYCIVPEFSSATILIGFITFTMLAAALAKKKQENTKPKLQTRSKRCFSTSVNDD
jgi:Trk-type K+ transport system membrane component